ncbi:hypothetical protein E2C01_071222 [Portunus trituberculatus]|uniref:Uncharacterized protein n=1 Tax=Portunus trituberculatus TaxID=210409 RepID=A0A5B7HWF5_PORTR|nr:hypothetical protein [Portunus trituberculatus]
MKTRGRQMHRDPLRFPFSPEQADYRPQLPLPLFIGSFTELSFRGVSCGGVRASRVGQGGGSARSCWCVYRDRDL